MVMAKAYAAYFDASGDRARGGTAPALTMSGFVATVHKWRRFEREWLALLDRFGIVPPFHMTDFEGCHGQYRKFRGQEESREQFRSEALQIITRCTSKAFTVGVVVPDPVE